MVPHILLDLLASVVIAKHLEQSVATDLSAMQTSVDMNGKMGLIL